VSSSCAGPRREDVEAALTEVRARLRAHGGDATVHDVEDGVAEIHWHGACRSCPAVALTLGGVVGPAALAVPGVRTIRSGRPVSPMALDRLERIARRYGSLPAGEVAAPTQAAPDSAGT
jgi:Fe-S cluster biogenesis protein NfuA